MVNALGAPAPFLPAGPYRVARGYGRGPSVLGGIQLILGIAMIVALATATLRRVGELQRDAAIWHATDGVEVRADVDARVKVELGLLRECRGRIQFVAADGSRHEGSLHFDLLTDFDRSGPSVVRHLPGDPTAFVHRWAGENLAGRWLFTMSFAMLGGVVAAGFSLLGCRWLAQGRLASAIADDGREATARLLAVRESRRLGPFVLQTAVVEIDSRDGPLRLAERTFGRRHGPPLRVGDQLTLVLVSPRRPRHCVVLREDLWPLELLPAQAEQVRQRLAGRENESA